MPRTRREVDRDAKVDELVAVAERQLLEGGLDGLSMAGVAREVGVAHNAVYWYFPSRDHLFIATLERILRSSVSARKPRHNADATVMALWFVDRIGEFQPLIAALYERARFSPVAAEFRDRVRSELRAMLLGAITPHVAAPERDLAADTFIAAAEGALVQGLQPKKRARLLTFLLAKLLGRAERT